MCTDESLQSFITSVSIDNSPGQVGTTTTTAAYLLAQPHMATKAAARGITRHPLEIAVANPSFKAVPSSTMANPSFKAVPSSTTVGTSAAVAGAFVVKLAD